MLLLPLAVDCKTNSFLIKFGSYSITILGFILYPLCGFMTDICCGRYWTVTMSLCLMALGALVNSIASPLHEESQPDNPAPIALSAVSYLLCLVGVAGFEANVVQFGLDQLMDHNSRYLSLYLHWLVWFETLGGTISITPPPPPPALADCDVLSISSNFELKSTFQLMPLPYFLFF